MRNGKTRRPQFLTTDEVSPSVDLVGCYQFHSDTEFFYRLPSHHLILIESGRIEARTATNRFEAKAGDLVCFRPSEINEYGTRGPTLFYQAHIQFAPPPRHRYTPWLNSFGSLPERLTLGNAFESMRRVFETWCIELGEEGEAHQLRVRAAVFEALAIIADVCARKSPSPTRLDDWQRVRMRLRSELAAEIKIEQLARQLGVSTDHFIRQFKHRFGMTPKAYHNQARLAEAARLLRSTDHPAKAIGFNVGFSDPKAFARAFKRHFGVAPSNLRLGNDPLPRRNEIAKGGLFAMNKHILPPHAGPDYTMKWRAQKVNPA